MTNANPSKEHTERVKQQMKSLGVTWFGMQKLEGRYLHKVIHENETLGGIIYGRYDGSSAMLVATNFRVIFLDRKPGFTNIEEITYDVVAGVTYNKQGSFASVTLHTRLGDFGMKYVNIRSAEQFTHFVELRRLEYENGQNTTKNGGAAKPEPQGGIYMNNDAMTFLKEHDTGVFSSVDKDGKVHGAVVYYVTKEDGHIYFITKSETKKAFSVRTVGTAAFTVYDAAQLQTLQIEGHADIETDQQTKEWVFNSIIKPRFTTQGEELPPVTKIKEGAFVVVRVKPSWSSFRDYSK